MSDDVIDFKRQLLELVDSYKNRLPLIEGVLSGQFTRNQVKRLGVGLYAEARSALQIKMPERLRICPLDEVHIRRFWWQMLAEESGDFKPGHDHASLIALTCRALGATHEQLAEEYKRYTDRLDTIRRAPPSLELTLRELTCMYVDEAVLARESNGLGDALSSHYGVPEQGLFYFRLHATVDIEHSEAALTTIARAATTPELRQIVLVTAEQCLAEFPIWIDRKEGLPS